MCNFYITRWSAEATTAHFGMGMPTGFNVFEAGRVSAGEAWSWARPMPMLFNAGECGGSLNGDFETALGFEVRRFPDSQIGTMPTDTVWVKRRAMTAPYGVGALL